MNLSKTLAVAVGLLDNNGETAPSITNDEQQQDDNNSQTPIEKSIDILIKLQTQILLIVNTNIIIPNANGREYCKLICLLPFHSKVHR